jgi:hypothetical protein
VGKERVVEIEEHTAQAAGIVRRKGGERLHGNANPDSP